MVALFDHVAGYACDGLCAPIAEWLGDNLDVVASRQRFEFGVWSQLRLFNHPSVFALDCNHSHTAASKILAVHFIERSSFECLVAQPCSDADALAEIREVSLRLDSGAFRR